MWRFLFISFLIAHGLVHLAIWLVPKPADGKVPFDVSHSWVLGDLKQLAVFLAVVAAALLVGGGVGLWAHAEWWRGVAVVGLAVSFGLMVLYFHPGSCHRGGERRTDRRHRLARLAVEGDGRSLTLT